MEDKKGEDILLLDLQELATFTDYFILCNGSSGRMLRSLADTVREFAWKSKLRARLEGNDEGGWMVVDMEDIVVHLFSPEQRDYYQLEQLWSNGKVLLRLQ